jgi:hypothetical protein
MRSLDQPEDVAKYLGHQMTWIGWDELGAFPDDHAYRMMFGCLRSSDPVECMRVRATGNPGGAGHHWLKARFIDAAPNGYEHIIDEQTNMARVYIPSRVTDNKILLARPRLYRPPVRRRQSRAGARLARGRLERYTRWIFSRVRSAAHHPAVCGATAVDQIPFVRLGEQPTIRVFVVCGRDGSAGYVPKGALVCYRELYGAVGPNVGLRLSAEQVADMIREREIGDKSGALRRR